MTDRPLVSVVVPTRDRQDLVPHAVRSVLGQTYPHLEVFVVDDGSSPAVQLPADIARDARITFVRLDEPAGSGPARDHAIERATGDLLAFCDDDDEWLPRKTEDQIAVLLADDRAVAVESGYEMQDGARLVYRYLPAHRDAYRTLLQRPIMAPTVVMARTRSVIEAGGFGRLERHHDWDLWIRMTKRRRVIALPRVHAVRRDHPELAFDLQLEFHQSFYEERIVPALDALPRSERARIEAHHLGVMGSYAAGAGSDERARALMLAGWKRRPTDVASLFRLTRTVIGERAWSVLIGGVHGLIRSGRRMTGRDPYLHRF